MVEMTAEQHDASTADAEFVTHLTGRLLDRDLLPPTPVTSKEYAALCNVADMTSGDSFDLFFGMFKYNTRAKDHLNKMRENLAMVERQLASKEAYLAASAEMKNTDRQRLIAETKLLLQEILQNSGADAKVLLQRKDDEKVMENEMTSSIDDADAPSTSTTRSSESTATIQERIPIVVSSAAIPPAETMTSTKSVQGKK